MHVTISEPKYKNNNNIKYIINSEHNSVNFGDIKRKTAL